MSNTTPSTPGAVMEPADTQVVVILILDATHEIRLDLLQRVRARIPELERDRDYSLEEICGTEFWAPLPKIHKIRGGSTIAYLVQTRQLPLEFASCPHAVPKRYRRK